MTETARLHVLVTGANGFIGRHLVAILLQRGHKIRAVGRDTEKARQLPWFNTVQWCCADVHDPHLDIEALTEGVDAMVHLAWPGLPHFNAKYHFEQTLFDDYRFLKAAVRAGLRRVLVTGTCFEYGLQNGPLSESMMTQPVTGYGLAKRTLLSFLQQLQVEESFTLQWGRLFYLFGAGQNPSSLLASLDRAIDNGDERFDMSSGEQLRDYLPVEQAAAYLATVLEGRAINAVFNCCSGQPLSVRKLVESRVYARKASIQLNLGHYPYAAHEPMAFWGTTDLLHSLLEDNHVA
jgi:nucleoside-diphosphate-sugar epimerase